MDDQNTPSEPVEEADVPEPTPIPVEPDSGQTTGSDPADTPPTAPESPINAPSNTPVEDQNQGVNQPESNEPEEPISAPSEPQAPTGESPTTSPIPSTSIPVAPVSASSSTSINESPTSEPVESLDQLQPNHSSQDQSGFIRGLLVKAQAKIQSNRQKKLDKVIELAQKKGTISNEDIQKSLHMPDRTATRYLVKLVEEGRLVRVGSPRDAKYRFLH
jgi:hypothetical protein